MMKSINKAEVRGFKDGQPFSVLRPMVFKDIIGIADDVFELLPDN
jgi:hypothetical protein